MDIKINRKKTIAVILSIFLIAILALIIYNAFFYINLDKYAFRKCIGVSESPDGKYKVDAILLGEKDEMGNNIDYIQSNKNDTYDIYARLWYEPEIREDGAIIWYDKKTKIIYYDKDRTDVKIEWLDNDTVQINGVTLNIHKDVYDYRRK